MVSPRARPASNPSPVAQAGRFAHARVHPRESETGHPWPIFHDSLRSSPIAA